MTGPGSWSPQPPPPGPPAFPPAFPPPAGQVPVAWAGGMAAPPPLPARPPVDVGGLLRLVAGGLLLVAGVLAGIACSLTMFEIDFDTGEDPFEATAWSDGGDRYPTPIRWGIPMAVAAAALVAGAVLVLASRWASGLRGPAAAVSAAAVGSVVSVGWLVGGYVSDLSDALTVTGEEFGIEQVVETGGGTVLLVVALWTALAAVVPLVLAPAFDAIRARRTGGGAR